MKYFSWKKLIGIALPLLLITGFLITLKPVTVQADGRSQNILTHASTVAVALREAGIPYTQGEDVQPGLDAPVEWGMTISVMAARQMMVVSGGITRWVQVPSSSQAIAKDVLAQAGISISPEEALVGEGSELRLSDSIPSTVQRLDVLPRMTIQIALDGQEQSATVFGPTVADALWQAGIRLRALDSADPSFTTSLASISSNPVRIQVIRAVPLRVQIGTEFVTVYGAGKTIGEALARAGFALTGLDYSVPDEQQPLPADGNIRIVRVREELLHEQSPIDFSSKVQPLPDLEIDQRQLVQAGAQGIRDRLVRVRYENGVEVARKAEGETILLEPKNRIQGYGTKIVPHTAVVEGQTITYWRMLSLYATAYSPCASAGEPGKCYSGTSSGKPAGRGVVGMVYSWYLLFGGQHVYIPGYGFGIVGDTGGGSPPGNHYWIDLGYDDGDPDIYAWGKWVTVYFLVPAEVVPGFLLP
jgi:resuscitation-promoting factor RpfB